MSDLAFLLTPLLAFFITAASPGPATLSLAATSMTRGRGAGIALAFGLTLGIAFWGALAAMGLGALLVHWAPGMFALRVLGGAYLLYLGVLSARSALSAETPSAKTITPSGGHQFGRGLLLNLTNPKSLLAWGAVIALGVGPDTTPAGVAMLTLLCVLITLVLYIGYAVLFSTSRMMAGYQRFRRWIEGVFAVLFGLAGVRLVLWRAEVP
jgi:threonine/homoserine/homoserine lactone efflux protein